MNDTVLNNTVLISGASIAGPTLAYWLNRCGFRPTVVEKASMVRPGGYPIDPFLYWLSGHHGTQPRFVWTDRPRPAAVWT